MKKTWLATLCFIFFCTAHGQQLASDSIFAIPDTAHSFTLEDFYKLIVQNHPIARQAVMLSDVAKQEIRFAQGNFDPKLESQFDLKKYNGTTYYKLFNGSVKLPTRSPLSPVVGLQRNEGKYLNPENYIPGEINLNQTYVGLLVPVGRGFLTDERRIALKQAEIFGDLMEAEQVKIINKLFLEGAKDYWQWYYSYYNYRVALNTTKIGEEIFKRVKLHYEGGEASPIDTVQAKITLLERQVSLQETLAEWKNTTLKLSTYLWDSLANPVDLPLKFAPVSDSAIGELSLHSLEELTNHAKINHPELRKMDLKLRQLELDKRLAREHMKPKIDISYYMLQQPFGQAPPDLSIDLTDNYKFGLDFSIPLFLRKERAKLSQTKIKIASTAYDRSLAARQVMNDIHTAYNYLLSNRLVVQHQSAMVENYFRLMNAELLNLDHGESDLFKINMQQEKLFQAQSKLIKVIAEFEKQKAVLYWAAAVNPLGEKLTSD